MKRLSDLISEATLHRNPASIPDTLSFEYQGVTWNRTIFYDGPENQPILYIMFKHTRYIVDVSCIEITWIGDTNEA